ncbi:MAG: type II toxin-antitoxin system HicB family antitoxin [Deltaproteobacteria bacterium]|nr:type II toxin-antitoxin system HicB family antitoxin [Deltaproteobacteria bacterium]
MGASPGRGVAADLTRALPVLNRFFRQVDAQSAEGRYVRRAVASLLAGFDKLPNRAASYWVRTDWSLPDAAAMPGLHLGDVHLRQTIAASIYRGERLYVAECPTLGIVTQGATLDDVIANLREAFEVSFDESTAAAHGLHPRATLVAQVEVARWAA